MQPSLLSSFIIFTQINKPQFLKNINEIEKENINSWECSKCTFQNSSSNITCSVCNTSNIHLSIWNCEKCTFENDYKQSNNFNNIK